MRLAIALFIILCSAGYLFSADKIWTGSGDDQSWNDEDNWFPQGEPVDSDDLTIDVYDVGVVCLQTYEAKSITIGGSKNSTLTSNNFVYGTISPDSTSDIAVLNSREGKIVLKGAAGTLTLKGQYKASKGNIAPQTDFIFWVE